MAILSSKRQITLPKELCDRLLVHPGDDLAILEHEGCLTIIKKVKGKSGGILRHLKADPRYTDGQSRDETIAQRQHIARTRGRRT